MTLHLRPLPPRIKADTRALKNARADILEDLRAVKREADHDREERAVSRELTDKRNAHLRDSQQFKQTGEAHV